MVWKTSFLLPGAGIPALTGPGPLLAAASGPKALRVVEPSLAQWQDLTRAGDSDQPSNPNQQWLFKELARPAGSPANDGFPAMPPRWGGGGGGDGTDVLWQQLFHPNSNEKVRRFVLDELVDRYDVGSVAAALRNVISAKDNNKYIQRRGRDNYVLLIEHAEFPQIAEDEAVMLRQLFADRYRRQKSRVWFLLDLYRRVLQVNGGNPEQERLTIAQMGDAEPAHELMKAFISRNLSPAAYLDILLVDYEGIAPLELSDRARILQMREDRANARGMYPLKIRAHTDARPTGLLAAHRNLMMGLGIMVTRTDWGYTIDLPEAHAGIVTRQLLDRGHEDLLELIEFNARDTEAEVPRSMDLEVQVGENLDDDLVILLTAINASQLIFQAPRLSVGPNRQLMMRHSIWCMPQTYPAFVRYWRRNQNVALRPDFREHLARIPELIFRHLGPRGDSPEDLERVYESQYRRHQNGQGDPWGGNSDEKFQTANQIARVYRHLWQHFGGEDFLRKVWFFLSMRDASQRPEAESEWHHWAAENYAKMMIELTKFVTAVPGIIEALSQSDDFLPVMEALDETMADSSNKGIWNQVAHIVNRYYSQAIKQYELD